mmetsp:Transcript_1905/g.3612  ORF Transcript_1905/g.3612 Transcript_1905/m.3612 type:complete len:248 (+) Transcript_1905:406-1149(+)
MIHLRRSFAFLNRYPRSVEKSLQCEFALLGFLARVSNGILDDVDTSVSNQCMGALEGTLVGVSMQFLQQCSTATKGQVVRSIATVFHRFQDQLQGLDVDSITLDHSDFVGQQFVTCARLCGTELFFQFVQHINDYLRYLSAVRTHNQDAVTLLNHSFELATPVVRASVENIITVTDASDKTLWILFQHVLHGLALAFFTPACHSAVLRGRNGETPASLPVAFIHTDQSCHRVCAHEVDEVRSTANCC